MLRGLRFDRGGNGGSGGGVGNDEGLYFFAFLAEHFCSCTSGTLEASDRNRPY